MLQLKTILNMQKECLFLLYFESPLCSSSTKSQPNINYLQYKNIKRKYRNIALTIAANVY